MSALDFDRTFQGLTLLHRPGYSLLPHDASTPVTFGFLVFL